MPEATNTTKTLQPPNDIELLRKILSLCDSAIKIGSYEEARTCTVRAQAVLDRLVRNRPEPRPVASRETPMPQYSNRPGYVDAAAGNIDGDDVIRKTE